MAQTYLPVATVGYSLDGVAENTTAVSTTGGAMDASDFVLYSQFYGTLYGAPAVGLPNNGLIVSGSRTYQLQSYTGFNVMHILPNTKDSLIFVTPQAFPSISLLSFGTQGVASVSITVRFTDNSTQVFNPVTMDDWFSIASPVYSGFDRVLRTTGTPAYVGTAGNPRMQGTDLTIACANQGKPIKRVIIQNNSAAHACIMSVSGAVPGYSVNAPPLLCSGASATLNATGFSTYSWQPVGSFAGSNSGTITVSPTATTDYTLLGTSVSGCPGYTVVTVNVSTGAPVLSLAGSSQSICLGAPATITASGALAYTLTSPAANGATFVPAATAAYTVTGANGCGSSSLVTTITVSPLLVTASAPLATVCSGSQATLTAAGATNYTWNPGPGTQSVYIPSPVANTIYTLTGATGNCIGITTITITTKPLPTISVSTNTTQTCIGGPVNLNASGNAVTYTWSPGNQPGGAITVNPTQTTQYTVTATNSVNCSSSALQVIYVNPSPTLNVTVSNTLVCPGGISNLLASGADTYSWSNTNTGTTATVMPVTTSNYTVTGSYTTGCFSTFSVTVSVFSPTVGVSSNTMVCKGASVTINASGAGSYVWTNNNSPFASITVGPTVATIYTVTGQITEPNSGLVCSATNTVQVLVNPTPTITATSNYSNNTICRGQTITLTGSGAGNAGTYAWAGGAAPAASVSATAAPLLDQTYTVTGTDANGCKSTAKILVKVVVCTGIKTNAANAPAISIYPNPSSGAIHIRSERAVDLVIIDGLGQAVRALKLSAANDYQTNVEDLPSGFYFVTYTEEGNMVSQKIVITR